MSTLEKKIEKEQIGGNIHIKEQNPLYRPCMKIETIKKNADSLISCKIRGRNVPEEKETNKDERIFTRKIILCNQCIRLIPLYRERLDLYKKEESKFYKEIKNGCKNAKAFNTIKKEFEAFKKKIQNKFPGLLENDLSEEDIEKKMKILNAEFNGRSGGIMLDEGKNNLMDVLLDFWIESESRNIKESIVLDEQWYKKQHFKKQFSIFSSYDQYFDKEYEKLFKSAFNELIDALKVAKQDEQDVEQVEKSSIGISIMDLENIISYWLHIIASLARKNGKSINPNAYKYKQTVMDDRSVNTGYEAYVHYKDNSDALPQDPTVETLRAKVISAGSILKEANRRVLKEIQKEARQIYRNPNQKRTLLFSNNVERYNSRQYIQDQEMVIGSPGDLVRQEESQLFDTLFLPKIPREERMEVLKDYIERHFLPFFTNFFVSHFREFTDIEEWKNFVGNKILENYNEQEIKDIFESIRNVYNQFKNTLLNELEYSTREHMEAVILDILKKYDLRQYINFETFRDNLRNLSYEYRQELQKELRDQNNQEISEKKIRKSLKARLEKISNKEIKEYLQYKLVWFSLLQKEIQSVWIHSFKERLLFLEGIKIEDSPSWKGQEQKVFVIDQKLQGLGPDVQEQLATQVLSTDSQDIKTSIQTVDKDFAEYLEEDSWGSNYAIKLRGIIETTDIDEDSTAAEDLITKAAVGNGNTEDDGIISEKCAVNVDDLFSLGGGEKEKTQGSIMPESQVPQVKRYLQTEALQEKQSRKLETDLHPKSMFNKVITRLFKRLGIK